MDDLDRERLLAIPERYEPDGDERGSIHEAVATHVRQFFEAPHADELVWTFGPKGKVPRRFRVIEIPPGPKIALWTYVSVGAWEVSDQTTGKLEFALFTTTATPRGVELVTMTAGYHRGHALGVGHTFPIGEPWVAGSACDHVLVSVPHPLGREFEICALDGEHLHILWLLPITPAEREFKKEHGLEALEQAFERAGLHYWATKRASVIA